jgi:CubicO group peptidase (beta-lactamase class C family)
MTVLVEEVDSLAAATGFSGVVQVDRDGDVQLARAYGLAHRGWVIPNEIDTRFGLASGGKGLTALAVVSLIVDGAIELSTTARSALGTDLPMIDDEVTVEHLLSHRSGIGDYLDEETYQLADYAIAVPVQQLAATEQYLAILDGYPQVFAPGERFSYCNGGFVVLALIAERVSGIPFHDLVGLRVCMPAGMDDTEFFRSDDLPGRTALGYVEMEGVLRSNVFHLPVRGSGDGGIYSTAADVSSLWRALFAGRIVPLEWVAEMVRPRSVTSHGDRYGLGFWLSPSTDAVMLVGSDAGVSFRTVHDPEQRLTHTTISNTSDGAWPITEMLNQRLGLESR